MNVLVSVNSKFLVPLKVLLYSLFLSQKDKCYIYLLNVQLSEKEISDLERYCSSLKMDLIVHEIPEDIKGVIEKKKEALKGYSLSIETYARLFAPVLLPGVSRVLWLDADCIVKEDISSFYNQNLGDFALAACDHCNWILPQVPGYSYYDYPIRKKDPEHFNAGVILFNLDNCRKIRGFQKENMKYIIRTSTESSFPFFDQSILNYLCPPSRVKWENPLIYNCYTNKYWASGFKDDPIQYTVMDKSSILHFCSPVKPWELLESCDPRIRKYWLDLYMDANKNGLL